MSWSDRLIRLATGDPRQLTCDALLRLYLASAERARRLAAHASMAPMAAGETRLRQLAEHEAELGRALESALRERGVEPPPPPTLPPDAGRSYWARLVADLEACRLARDQLRGQRANLIEHDTSLAELLGSLLAGFDAQAAGLRELIARADPQALD